MVPLIRKALPFLTAAVLAAGLYDGWLFFSRWRDAREIERTMQARKADEARRTIEMLGGGQLKILSFYAAPATVRRGHQANICYGVYGAKSVRIEPGVEPLYPAIARCLPVSPSRSTEYTLEAEDGEGHTASQQFLLRVAP